MRLVAAATLGAALVAVGCSRGTATSRGVAERFLDAFYVRIDLPTALALTTGLARRKVAEEIRLTLGEGQLIDETTRTPRIYYRLLEEHPVDDRTTRYLYRATIAVEDADTFERRWLLTMRREDDAWRVADYEQLPD